MVTRILNSLNARRKQLGENEKGFTLIELLVVVIIIGILAAIAIPVYLGVQNNAKDAGAQSDLVNAKTAVVGYFTANPAGPAPILSDLGTFGYSVSANTTSVDFSGTAPTKAGDAFCITAESTVPTTFYVSDSVAVSKTAC